MSVPPQRGRGDRWTLFEARLAETMDTFWPPVNAALAAARVRAMLGADVEFDTRDDGTHQGRIVWALDGDDQL